MVDGALITVCLEYFDFADIFFLELLVGLSENIRINNHAIDLVDNK